MPYDGYGYVAVPPIFQWMEVQGTPDEQPEAELSPPPTRAEILDVLRRTRAFIARHKWGRGAMSRPNNHYCLTAALSVVRDDMRGWPSRKNLPFVQALGFCTLTSTWQWNDTRRLFGKWQVLRLFDRAIARLSLELAQ